MGTQCPELSHSLLHRGHMGHPVRKLKNKRNKENKSLTILEKKKNEKKKKKKNKTRKTKQTKKLCLKWCTLLCNLLYCAHYISSKCSLVLKCKF